MEEAEELLNQVTDLVDKLESSGVSPLNTTLPISNPDKHNVFNSAASQSEAGSPLNLDHSSRPNYFSNRGDYCRPTCLMNL